jgi:phosphatidylglycerol---prolipoprotein diacylglyceryl transferase
MLLRCYPKITDWLYFLFNQSPAADYRFLPLYSYGFFVAVGFFAAATLAVAEMRRRETLGLLTGVESEIRIGEAPTLSELAFYFLFGFVIFFKLTGLFVYHDVLSSRQLAFTTYLVSASGGTLIQKFGSFFTYGSYMGGIAGGGLLAFYYYYSRNKEKLSEVITKKIMIYPSDSIGDLLIIALVLGVLGSNLFNFLENPEDYQNFMSDPVGSIFSGLSVYGGLICAGIGFFIYARAKKFNLAHFFDSVCPGFILANGIGRLGCQAAGDGDWGIMNVHPKPDWIPQVLWSSHYEHNIIDYDPGSIIPGCSEEHCHFLTNAVYPTPLYEFLMCTAVFFILWALRKKLTNKPGMLFAIFGILIGIQRYSIEQWRDLSGRGLFHILGMAFRQSELISIALFLAGIAGTVYLYTKYKNTDSATHVNGHS